MHYTPATLLLLGAVASTARASNDNQPVPKSGLQESWASPARETVAVGHDNEQQVALGWSPKPTQAPKPLLGRMMIPRADDFTIGPQTCGFVPGTTGSELGLVLRLEFGILTVCRFVHVYIGWLYMHTSSQLCWMLRTK